MTLAGLGNDLLPHRIDHDFCGIVQPEFLHEVRSMGFYSVKAEGPCLVTADELTEPHNLRLRTLVNGKIMQDGSTSEWLFPLPKLLSRLSEVMTLEPGDVVSTGTHAGVGVFRKPPTFLAPGDRVVLEIDKIGRLENPVVGTV